MAVNRETEIDRIKQKVLDMDDVEFAEFLGWAKAAGDVKRHEAARKTRIRATAQTPDHGISKETEK